MLGGEGVGGLFTFHHQRVLFTQTINQYTSPFTLLWAQGLAIVGQLKETFSKDTELKFSGGKPEGGFYYRRLVKTGFCPKKFGQTNGQQCHFNE